MADTQTAANQNADEQVRDEEQDTDSTDPPEPVEEAVEEVEDDDRFQATDN